MPSVTFLRLSYVSVICRVTYFQFAIQSVFLPYIGRQTALALRRTIGFNTQYRTSDAAENLGRYVSCTERSEFRRSVIIAKLWRPEVSRPGNVVSIFVFFVLEKRTLTVKFSKFCSERFHRLIDQRCCVQIS